MRFKSTSVSLALTILVASSCVSRKTFHDDAASTDGTRTADTSGGPGGDSAGGSDLSGQSDLADLAGNADVLNTADVPVSPPDAPDKTEDSGQPPQTGGSSGSDGNVATGGTSAGGASGSVATGGAGVGGTSGGTGGLIATGGVGAGGTSGGMGGKTNVDAPVATGGASAGGTGGGAGGSPAPLDNGSKCSAGSDCSSKICADGVCCDKACTGTCEACDVVTSAGTCTTLAANATPRPGRTACVATDPTCAGKCNGTSAACAYPPATTSCGTASCTGTSYQPVGSCNTGACSMPAKQSCPTNQTCAGNACACQSPYQTCSSTCVDTNTDGANCGICGKSCGSGSACSTGKCQPITMTSSLGGYSFVFWVDASYVYYNDCSTYYDCVPKRIALSAVGGSGSSLTTINCSGYAVMGSSLFLFESQVASFLCTVGSSCQVNSSSHVPDGMPVGFKNPAPSYVAVITSSNTNTDITTWYTATNATYTAYQNFYWSYDCAGGLSNFASAGNYQYWACGNGSGSYAIWRTNGTIPATATSQITGGFTFYPNLVDANSVSLIYLDGNTNNLYRVPVPGGLGTMAPQLIVSSTGTKMATEDSSGIYWIDTLANLNRCTASSCSSTTTVMTTGQTLGNYFTGNGYISGTLYQDSSYLYWINGSGQLMKLAK